MRNSYERAASVQTNGIETTQNLVQNAKNKLYTYDKSFDEIIEDFVNNEGGYPAWWKLSDLSPSEYNALKLNLEGRGIKLSSDSEGYLRLSK